MNNSQVWINIGYDLFAQEGHEGLQVERLARILKLNKSGFYHYFGDHDIYFQYLVQHHHERVGELLNDMHTIHSFDPEFLRVMINHRVTVMAHMQLMRNRHIKLFDKAFKATNDKLDQELLPLWTRYIGHAYLQHHPEIAIRYFALQRDAFYARVTFETMSYEFLHDHFSEAKSLLHEITVPEPSSFTLAFPVVMSNKKELQLSGV